MTYSRTSQIHIQYKTCKIITFIGRRNLIISWISAEQHITASHLTRINPRGKYQKNKSNFKKESSLNLIIVYLASGDFMHKIFYFEYHHLFVLNSCRHPFNVFSTNTYISSISNQMFSLKRYKIIITFPHWYAMHLHNNS